MPNWCINQLEVKGPKAQLDKFLLQAKRKKTKEECKSDLSLEALMPTPADLLSREATGSSMEALNSEPAKRADDDWYSWRVRNWGTKWDIDADADRINSKSATFGFNSAWSPPSKGIQAVSKLFPKLTFVLAYDEPGMGFDGEVTFKAGVIVEEDYNQGGDYTGRLCGAPEEDEDEA